MVRLSSENRRRIKSPIGSPGFFIELTELESQAPAASAPLPGTVGALIAAYKESTEFTQLKPRTRADYLQVFDYLRPLEHDVLIDITAGYVADVRDAAFKKKAPLCQLRENRSLAAVHLGDLARHHGGKPGARVKKIQRPADAPEANRRWTVAELQIVMAAAPLETRVAIGLAVCTALRESDVVRWPWSGYKDGKIQGKDAKTGTPIWMPAHPMLVALLEEARTRAIARAQKKGSNVLPLSLSPDRPIVVGQRGRPLTAAGLRANFFKVVRELIKARLVAPGLTFHGLRTTSATMLAEADCDDETIQSVTGHTTTAMVAHYRPAADRKRRAARGIPSLDFGLAGTRHNEGGE